MVIFKSSNRGQTPPACEASLSLAAPVSLFQSSPSSPCALIRDPSSHSGTTLRLFQLLPSSFRREFLNWQLEHEPNRRTEAIRQEEERVERRQRGEGKKKLVWCHVSLHDESWMREWVWTAHSTHGPRPRPCVRVSDHAVNYAMLHVAWAAQLYHCASDCGSCITEKYAHTQIHTSIYTKCITVHINVTRLSALSAASVSLWTCYGILILFQTKLDYNFWKYANVEEDLASTMYNKYESVKSTSTSCNVNLKWLIPLETFSL